MDELRTLKTSGVSMSPFLLPEDKLHVRKVRPKEIRWGDLLLFAERTPEGTRVKVHRVLWRQDTPRGPAFWTKGDNVVLPDDPVPAFAVLGRVAARERGGEILGIEGGFGRGLSIATGLWANAATFAGAAKDRIAQRLADVRGRSQFYTSKLLSYPARLLPAGLRPWRLAKDRFHRTGRCMPRRDGAVVELRGILQGDLTLSGEIILTGDVQVPEGVTLRLAAGATVRARPQSLKLSVVRRHHGRTVEFCDPAGAQLVVRGALRLEGSEEQPVVLDFQSGFQGLILTGEARLEARHARVDAADSMRAVTALDASTARLENCAFLAGRTAVVAAQEASVEVERCVFEKQTEAALAGYDRATISLRGTQVAGSVAAIRLGNRSSAAVEDLTVQDCGSGALLSAHAKLRARGLRCAGTESPLVAIQHAEAVVEHGELDGGRVGALASQSSRVELRECRLEGQTEASIAAYEGAAVVGRNLKLKKALAAVRLEGSAHGELEDCAVEDCASGALLGSDALLSARGLDCSGCGSPVVTQGRARALIERAKISGGEASLSAYQASSISAHEIAFEKSLVALRLEDSARGELERGRIRECATGVLLGHRARLTARGLDVAATPSPLVVKDDGDASVRSSTFVGGRIGAYASDDARLRLELCRLHEQSESAVAGSERARIEVSRLSARNSAAGLRLEGSTRMNVRRSALDSCETGALADGASRLTLYESRIRGGKLGLHAQSHAELAVAGCELEGQSASGISGEGEARIRVSDCGLQAPVGLQLDGSCRAYATRTRFRAGRLGVLAHGRSRLIAARCAFGGQEKACLSAQDDAALTTLGSKLSDAGAGALLAGGARGLFLASRVSRMKNVCVSAERGGLWLAANEFGSSPKGVSSSGGFVRAIATPMQNVDEALVLDKSRALWIDGSGEGYRKCFLRCENSEIFLFRTRQSALGPICVDARGGRLRVVACRLRASSAAISVESGQAWLLAVALEGSAGVRLAKDATLGGRWIDGSGCSIGRLEFGSVRSPQIAGAKRPQYLDRLSLGDSNIALENAARRHPGDAALRLAILLRRMPGGLSLLGWPYRLCLWMARRRFSRAAGLWLRRSWASGQAQPGLSDLDLLLELRDSDDPNLERLGGSWKNLRKWFPFLGEPIIAGREDVELYARHGDLRSRLAAGEWQALSAGERAWPAASPASSTKLALDRWTEAFNAYLRLVATNSDLQMLKHRELTEHRFKRSWNKTWKYGVDSQEEPPAMADDRYEACAQTLDRLDQGARAILAAIDRESPGLWTPSTLRAEPELAVPEEERVITQGLSLVIEQPRHLSYLVLSPQLAREEWARTFKAALYIRARFEFLRCLALPVTEAVFAALLCGPYQDWPYQTKTAATWPAFRIPGGSGEAAVRQWASADHPGTKGGFELELLVECWANARLHRRARILGLVDNEDPGVRPEERVSVLYSLIGRDARPR